LTKQSLVKWPFKFIQGDLLWCQWKGDEGLNNNVGLTSNVSEEIANESAKLPFSTTPLSFDAVVGSEIACILKESA